VRSCIAVFLAAALAGCGAEVVGTAATGAAIKKQELEQARRTQDQVQQKIGAAMELQQQRAGEAADK
jgi:hypothetical protein